MSQATAPVEAKHYKAPPERPGQDVYECGALLNGQSVVLDRADLSLDLSGLSADWAPAVVFKPQAKPAPRRAPNVHYPPGPYRPPTSVRPPI